MSLLYAWCNLRQNRRRTAAALAGLTFAILLVFLHLGLLAAVRRATTQLYESFDFDVILVSRGYQHLGSLREFDRVRLMQSTVVPGVADVLPVGIANVRWTNPETLQRFSIQLVGVPVRPDFLRHPQLRAQLSRLAGGGTVLLDALARRSLGHVSPGDYVEINDRKVRVAGGYSLGAALEADGGAFIEHEAWQRLTGRTGREIGFGLIRTQPGFDPSAVARDLRTALPADMLVFTREEFIRGEQDYLTRVKPLGIVFQIGAVVGCVAGAVMLFQVLATDITLRLREYATLKAMGFRIGFLLQVGLCQAALCLTFSTGAAALLAAALFFEIRLLTTLPSWIDAPLALQLAGLVAAFGLVSTGLALWRVRRAAPAELFA